MDNPYIPLLDEETAVIEVDKLFRPYLALTREVCNYGTNLLKRSLGDKADVTSTVTVAVLGKQVVSALDAIELLARTGAGLGARVLLRTLLEASWHCELLLLSSEEYSKAFYVAHLRRELKFAKYLSPDDSEEHRRYCRAVNRDPRLGLSEEQKKDMQSRCVTIQSLLDTEFKELNQKFDDCVQKSRMKNPPWYKIMGIGTIRDIAEKLGHLDEYFVLYEMYSQDVHSSSIGNHIEIGEDNILVLPIRGTHQLADVLHLSNFTAIRVYKTLLGKYRSGELPSFERIFREEWRPRLNNLLKIP